MTGQSGIQTKILMAQLTELEFGVLDHSATTLDHSATTLHEANSQVRSNDISQMT